MTEDDAYTAVCAWVELTTSRRTIRQYEEGRVPSLPYMAINLINSGRAIPGGQRITRVVNDTRDPDTNPKGDASVYSLIDWEWTFSIHSYGDSPTDPLQRITSAIQSPQAQEPLFPELVPHDVSDIRRVPERVHNRWEPRAQMDLFVRGFQREPFYTDLIEEASVDITRET